MREIKGHKIFDAFRGMKAKNENLLIDMLVRIGRIRFTIPEIKETDLTPVVFSGSKPVAVDALVILKEIKMKD